MARKKQQKNLKEHTITSLLRPCAFHYSQYTLTFSISWCLRCGRLTYPLPCWSFCFRSLFLLVLFILLVRCRTKEVAQGTSPRVWVVQQSTKILLIPQRFTLYPDGTKPRPRKRWGVFVPFHEIPGTNSLFACYLKTLKKTIGTTKQWENIT